MAKALAILALAVSATVMPPVLAGCWSSKELETLAVIQAAGIDRIGDNLRLTLQIVQPIGQAAGGPMGGGGGGAMTFGRKAVWNVSADGSDIQEAARAIERRSPRSLFWGHNQLIVLGGSAASHGVGPILDSFIRSPHSRIISWVVVSETDAQVVLGSEPPFSPIPVRSLTLPLNRGLFPSVRLQRFVELLRTDGVDPFAAAVETVPSSEAGVDKLKQEPSSEVRFTGTALFREDRLVGFLDTQESLGFFLARGERISRTPVTFPSPEGEGLVSVLITRLRRQIHSEIDGDTIRFTIKVTADGDLAEVSDPSLDLTKPEVIRKLNRALCDRVDSLVMRAVERQKALGCDVIGLGQELRKRDPETWRTLKSHWYAKLRETEVGVECEVKIRRTGLIAAAKR